VDDLNPCRPPVILQRKPNSQIVCFGPFGRRKFHTSSSAGRFCGKEVIEDNKQRQRLAMDTQNTELINKISGVEAKLSNAISDDDRNQIRQIDQDLVAATEPFSAM
jgi:hypothetical protein